MLFGQEILEGPKPESGRKAKDYISSVFSVSLW